MFGLHRTLGCPKSLSLFATYSRSGRIQIQSHSPPLEFEAGSDRRIILLAPASHAGHVRPAFSVTVPGLGPTPSGVRGTLQSAVFTLRDRSLGIKPGSSAVCSTARTPSWVAKPLFSSGSRPRLAPCEGTSLTYSKQKTPAANLERGEGLTLPQPG